MDIERIRQEQFSITRRLIYLQHAGVSPLSAGSARKGQEQIESQLFVSRLS